MTMSDKSDWITIEEAQKRSKEVDEHNDITLKIVLIVIGLVVGIVIGIVIGSEAGNRTGCLGGGTYIYSTASGPVYQCDDGTISD
jgi:hypothetical protein